MKSTSDIDAILHTLVQHGLENTDPRVVHEALVSIPLLFPPNYQEFQNLGCYSVKPNDESVESEYSEYTNEEDVPSLAILTDGLAVKLTGGIIILRGHGSFAISG